MGRIALFFAMLFHGFPGEAQKINVRKAENLIRQDASLFKFSDRTKVLLVGVFHFDFPNNDSHKIDSSRMIDVLSGKRQKEIKEVVDLLKEYRPTRIYIESQQQEKMDSLFSTYKKGAYELERNEKYQICFRLAKDLGHKKLYAVDDKNWAMENANRYGWIDSLWSYAEVNDINEADKWNIAYSTYYHRNDSLITEMSIGESLLYYSMPQTGNLMLGNYLVGSFNTADDKGPDRTALQWYSRNLRIFNNILSTKPGRNDRILVLFGAGHIPILRHVFQSSPQFEIVELADVLRIKNN